MYKASNTMLPENIQRQFSKNQDIHKYGTRNKEKMFVSGVNSKLKQMSTNVMGVKLWNDLDSTIRNSFSINVFKKKLKYKYISNY